MSDENFVNIARLMMTNDFEIVDLPDDLKCVKCKLALKDACKVPCGCTFCRVCIDDMLVREIKFCPGLSDDCRESSLELFESDYRANNSVSKLTAKCVIDGCMQECELGNMEEHLRECSKRNVECPFRESGCEEGNFLAEEMNEHLRLKHLTHSEILIRMIANMKQDIEMLMQNKEEGRKEFDMLKQRDRSIRTEIEVLKQRDEDNKKEIEVLKQREEDNKKDIEALKQRDDDNKKEIDVLKQGDANNKNEMQVMSQKDDERRKEIELLEQSLMENVEQIKGKVEKANCENKSISRNVTLIKSKEENLVDSIKVLSARLDREIDHREKIHKLELSTIENMKMEIIESRKLIQLLQTLVGPVDASCEWLINQNVRTSSWDKGSIGSDCFIGEKRPYKYRLASWNGSDSLWIMLLILPGPHDDQLAWPFEGRVVITVADKDRREACRRISRPCKIRRPLDSNGKVSNYFKFSHSELTEAGLDLSRGLCVSCLIVSIAGA